MPFKEYEQSTFRYEYGNIGKQVYDALKDGAYHQFKAYVAKKAVIATGDVDKIRLPYRDILIEFSSKPI